MARKPKRVDVTAFNVGFGDCFLLSFVYAKEEKKHVLIDFGSASPPKRDPTLVKTARAIAQACGGRLDAVVATHRHKDHISGFAAGTPAGDIIRRCADAGNALVVQPWTEKPGAAVNATGKRRRASTAAYLEQLESMHTFAGVVRDETKRLRKLHMDAAIGEPMHRAETVGTEREPGEDAVEEKRKVTVATNFAGTAASKSLVDRLEFVGEDNTKNVKAVQNLMEMGGEHRYVAFGDDSGLEKVLPGVKVHVLGPPTVDQYDSVQKQRSTDPDEFWQMRASLWQERRQFWQMQALHAGPAVRKALRSMFGRYGRKSPVPPSARWFVRRLRGARAKQLLELVLIMDEALNNTSVILLFEIGRKKLLFPGDAQIENWEYALEHPNKRTRARIRELLAGVDFYKVGHHGSRNATPKSLWNLFAKRSRNSKDPERMRSMISTKGRVHGSIERNTEVPRRTLVAALAAETKYISVGRKVFVTEEIPL